MKIKAQGIPAPPNNLPLERPSCDPRNPASTLFGRVPEPPHPLVSLPISFLQTAIAGGVRRSMKISCKALSPAIARTSPTFDVDFQVGSPRCGCRVSGDAAAADRAAPNIWASRIQALSTQD